MRLGLALLVVVPGRRGAGGGRLDPLRPRRRRLDHHPRRDDRAKLTSGGGWTSPSMADDGTIVALRGACSRACAGRRAIGTPLAAVGGGWSRGGPYDARVSPDGLQVAYWFTGRRRLPADRAELLAAGHRRLRLRVRRPRDRPARARRGARPPPAVVVRLRPRARVPPRLRDGRDGLGQPRRPRRVRRQGWFSYDDGTELAQGQLDRAGVGSGGRRRQADPPARRQLARPRCRRYARGPAGPFWPPHRRPTAHARPCAPDASTLAGLIPDSAAAGPDLLCTATPAARRHRPRPGRVDPQAASVRPPAARQPAVRGPRTRRVLRRRRAAGTQRLTRCSRGAPHRVLAPYAAPSRAVRGAGPLSVARS